MGDVAVFVAYCVGLTSRVDWFFEYDGGDINLGIIGGRDKHLLIFAERSWAMEDGVETSFGGKGEGTVILNAERGACGGAEVEPVFIAVHECCFGRWMIVEVAIGARVATDDDAFEGARVEFVGGRAVNPGDSKHGNKISKVGFCAVEHFIGGGGIVVAKMEG